MAVGSSEDAARWPRKGVPHFMQPHAFIPRGRLELREHLPDVYSALIDAGARDVDGRPKLPGDVRPEDEDLQFLAVRRPLIEWALRRAVAQAPGIEVRAGVHVTGLSIRGGRVDAVEVDGADVAVEVVVMRWVGAPRLPAGQELKLSARLRREAGTFPSPASVVSSTTAATTGCGPVSSSLMGRGYLVPEVTWGIWALQPSPATTGPSR